MTDKNIKRLIESIDTIDIGKSAIEPAVDASVGIKLMGYKDPDGNARRLLVKGENVPTKEVFPETDDTHNVGGSANTYKDAFFKDENGVVFTARQLATSALGASAVATSNDGTTTLTISNKDKIVVSGTGVNHQIDLGDATTYAVGIERKIVNASSEIIGVVNSDNSAWERLQPNCTLFAVLVDNSAAAGVWNVRKTDIQLRDGQRAFSMFQNGPTALTPSGDLVLSSVSNGTGARIALGSYENGVMRVESGTDANSYAFVWGTSKFQKITEGPHQLVVNIAVDSLSDGVDDYIVKAGFVTGVATPTQTNEIVIEYDYNGNGNVQSWFSRTRSAAAATSTTSLAASPESGLASNTSVSQTLIVEIASGGTRADFYISGSSAHASETSDINTGGGYYPFASIEKVSGTNERLAGIEAIGINRVLGTKRW